MSEEFSYLGDYFVQATERQRQGVEPLPVNSEQMTELCQLLQDPPEGSEKTLFNLLTERVPAGVDDAAKVKAAFLADILNDKVSSPLLDKHAAIEILGRMKGGFNVEPLMQALKQPELKDEAVEALSRTLLIYDAFDTLCAWCNEGLEGAKELMQRYAEGTWFKNRAALPERITLKVMKVAGEVTTDDFSPATDAWSRADIPLHAQAMFKNSRPDLQADEEGVRGPMKLIAKLKEEGYPLCYVGDVVGTGSSRKSAANSLIWHIGEDIPGIPNKRSGGYVLGGKIAPIFYNTLEDSGALPIECDVASIENGMVIDLEPYSGKVLNHADGSVLAAFELRPAIFDEVRAGGRIELIIGRSLTAKAREFLGLPPADFFASAPEVKGEGGFTRAQKIVGRACGKAGVRPGEYCEPKVATVGSQDTTGPMTRDELRDLACLKFQSPLVMQSFCHTCAYPKSVDIKTQSTLPGFMTERGGVALRPGDGVIHCFLNRMCLPDCVGTGGDSHTRMPLGISFPAGSGLVAFAAATGMMPLNMPESVLVRFKGERRPGITLRDLVHAIPYFAIKQGLLTVDKQGKKNIFNGRILEIEGLEDLPCEHAFELADASAERSAAACAISLNKERVVEYLKSNAAFLRELASEGYQDKDALLRRADAMDEYAAHYQPIHADPDCSYAAVLEIDMGEITEPILCVPSDPDDVHLLSELSDTHIDECFVGSCMTNIGHYRAAAAILGQCEGEVPVRLWMAPPTRMDQAELKREGAFSVFGRAGARIEVPGCSLCMGNQARVRDNAVVLSTSTRNFKNRLGRGAQVYLGSAELACVSAMLGRLPKLNEYFDAVKVLEGHESEIYQLLDFAK